MKIGVLSDTHGWIHPRLNDFFKDCDEIWHAGDIGNIDTADMLAAMKPLRAVWGNIDGHELRRAYSATLFFRVCDIDVLMLHIGGRPGKYPPAVRDLIRDKKPAVFICGHSHIAMIKYDSTEGCLYVNPGAAGRNGFHKIMTALRFNISAGKITDMELIELGERGSLKPDW